MRYYSETTGRSTYANESADSERYCFGDGPTTEDTNGGDDSGSPNDRTQRSRRTDGRATSSKAGVASTAYSNTAWN